MAILFGRLEKFNEILSLTKANAVQPNTSYTVEYFLSLPKLTKPYRNKGTTNRNKRIKSQDQKVNGSK